MNKATFDTRFFAELYYSQDESAKKKIKSKRAQRGNYISAVVIHEMYKLAIARQGREVAKNIVADLRQDFDVIPIDDQIAELSAELSHKYHLPMGDSMIAATALLLKAICVTDDPHFKQIKEIETSWI